MSEQQTNRIGAPPCPVCLGDTDIKQVHREPMREVTVYKCRSCAVEYPVVAPAR